MTKVTSKSMVYIKRIKINNYKCKKSPIVVKLEAK